MNATAVPAIDIGNPKLAVNVKVKKFAYDGSYTLIDTLQVIAVEGYSDYYQGANATIVNPNEFGGTTFTCLTPNNSLRYTASNLNESFFNVIIDHDGTEEFTVEYNGGTPVVILDSGDPAGIYNMVVPYSDVANQSEKKVTVKVTAEFTPIEELNLTLLRECEPKYTPHKIDFVNRYGGWDFITFYKTRRDSVQAKSETYQLTQDDWQYNQTQGQSKSFNNDLRKSIKLSTGWIDESLNDAVMDLLASRNVKLNGAIPITVKTQSIDLQTKINEKLINYTIDFELNYNLLNDQQ
jgi:hypothetical protein